MQIKGRIRAIKPHDKTVTLQIQIRGEDFTPDAIKGFKELGMKTFMLLFEPLHDRHVSATREQINAIYYLVNAYAYEIKEMKDYAKAELKEIYHRMTGHEIVSFGNIDRLAASDFIEKLFHISLRDKWCPWKPYEAPVIRNEVVIGCFVTRRCACCGSHAEMHHIEAIGMGSDRATYDDSKHRVIMLCRGCHNQAHSIGWPEFEKLYNLQDITVTRWDVEHQIEVRGWQQGNYFLEEQ